MSALLTIDDGQFERTFRVPFVYSLKTRPQLIFDCFSGKQTTQPR